MNVNLANLYALKSTYDFKKAKYHYNRNLKNAKKNNNIKYLANSYLNLGELYLNKKNDSCLFFFNKSIEFNKNDVGDDIIFSEAYRNLSDYYTYKNNLPYALKNIKTSLNFSFNTSNNEKIFKLSNNYLLNVTNKRNIIKAIKSKIFILLKLYKKTNNSNYLYEAISIINFTDNFLEVIINYSSENKTKFLWREEVSEIYKLGVDIAHQLGKNDLTFKFLEKNRAFLLINDINKNISKSDLPKTILKRDLFFRKKILKLEEQPNKKDSLFNLKEKYQNFLDSISKNQAVFLNSVRTIEHISLKELKTKLAKNEVVLSYSSYNNKKRNEFDHLIGILVSRDSVLTFKQNNISEFTSLINEYKKPISKPLTKKKELNLFKKTSNNLYSKLFPDEFKELISGKNLIIVPDISFEDISFESLNINTDKLKYLVENHNINYAYSISFLISNNKTERKPKNIFTGFAPVKFYNKKLPSLLGAKDELININSHFNGNYFMNKNSTKENFLREISNPKILHLATHTTESKTPTIYFYKDSLKLYELYTTKNNADLVVLNTCKSNLGEIIQGEGSLSLTRGFFYSGTNAVISSLWNVNDSSSSFLMKNFYKNLKNNQSKTAALANAKRSYLRQHNLSEKSPYYWASLILTGDSDITFQKNYTRYYFAAALVLTIFIFFFYKKNG